MEDKNIIIAVACLINIIIITIKFYMSKRVDNGETKIYGFLLLSMLIESVMGIILFVTMNSSQLIINLFNGLYLSTITTWISLFSLYMIRVSENDEKKYKIIRTILLIVTLISIICEFILPRNILLLENNQFSANGPAIYTVYIFSGLCILIVSYYLFKNIKEIFDKKYLPILIMLLSGFVLMILQSIAPELFLVTPIHSYITFIMFFTIENPDVKMLAKVQYAKEQAERANHA